MDNATQQVLEVDDPTMSKRRWRLAFTADELVVQAADGSATWTVRRAEAAKRMRLLQLGGQHILHVRERGARAIGIDRSTSEALWAWRGAVDARDLREEVGSGFWLRLVVGVLLALSSLPMAGDAAAGIEALPADPVGQALGFGLAALAIGGRFFPHPALLALDAVWCLALLADIVAGMLHGQSAWFLLLAPLLIGLAYHRLRRFARMRHIRA